MWGAPRERWSAAPVPRGAAGAGARALPGRARTGRRARTAARSRTRPTRARRSYYGVGAYLRPLEDARRSEVRFASECLAFANVPGRARPARRPGRARRTTRRWKARTPRDLGAGWDFDDVRDHYVAAPVRRRSDRAALRRSRSLPRARPRRDRRGHGGGRSASGAAARSTCRGGLVWFLRDLWPGAGWGVVDAAGAPKAAYYYLRRALAAGRRSPSPTRASTGSPSTSSTSARRALAGELEVVALPRGRDPSSSAARARCRWCPRAAASRSPRVELFEGFRDLSYAYRFGPPVARSRRGDAARCAGARARRGVPLPGRAGLPRASATSASPPSRAGRGRRRHADRAHAPLRPGGRDRRRRLRRPTTTTSTSRRAASAASASRAPAPGRAPLRGTLQRAQRGGRRDARRSRPSSRRRMSAQPEPLFFGPPADRPLRLAAPAGRVRPAGDRRARALQSVRLRSDLRAPQPAPLRESPRPRRGVPALRFDYDGTGDSAGDDRDPGRARRLGRQHPRRGRRAATRWRASSASASSASGSARCWRRSPPPSATTSPASWRSRRSSSGKAYLRELRALQMALGLARAAGRARAPPTASRRRVGFRITAETQTALGEDRPRARRRRPAPARADPRSRRPAGGRRVGRAPARGAAPTSTAAPARLRRDGRSIRTRRRCPTTIVARSTGWLRETAAAPAGAAHPPAARRRPSGSASLATDAGRGRRRERGVLDRRRRRQLFGILTAPEGAGRRARQGDPAAQRRIDPPHRAQPALRRARAPLGRARHTSSCASTSRASATARRVRASARTSSTRPARCEDIAGGARVPAAPARRHRRPRRRALLGRVQRVQGRGRRTAVDGIVPINPLTFFWKEGMSLDYPPHRVAADARRYASSLLRLDVVEEAPARRGQAGPGGAGRAPRTPPAAPRATFATPPVPSDAPFPDDLGAELAAHREARRAHPLRVRGRRSGPAICCTNRAARRSAGCAARERSRSTSSTAPTTPSRRSGRTTSWPIG